MNHRNDKIASLDAYVQKSHGDPASRAGAIHPSSLGGCVRAAVYQYNGMEPTLPPARKLLGRWRMGYAVEADVNEAHREAGILIAKNVPIVGEYNGVRIEGVVDEIVWTLDRRHWCILDVKTVEDKAMEADEQYGNFPYHSHIVQLGVYEYCLRQMADGRWDDLNDLPFSHMRCPLVLYVSIPSMIEKQVLALGATAKAMAALDEITGYINRNELPPVPFYSPEEHPYLCARCTDRGTMKRAPRFVPNCFHFKACWGSQPPEWSAWDEAEELPF